VPGYLALLSGLVAVASDEADAPTGGPYLAFGLALIPFVFIALAFLSEHPRAPAGVVRAMVAALVIGIPASALAADAVTGLVAGMGAGGIFALRADEERAWRARAIAVVVATAWTFLTLRTATDVALLLAPALPFTAVGVADHLVEYRKERRG
jgi:hypothetical protein